MGYFGVRPYAERTRQNRYLFNKYYNENRNNNFDRNQ